MSWVTGIGSAVAAMSMTLGAIHIVTWCRDRKQWANLAFAGVAVSIAILACLEFAAMHADSTARFGEVIRWGHVLVFTLQISVVGFVAAMFGTMRWWLIFLGIGVRLVCLLANFLLGPNLNYRAIIALQQVRFLGEPIWVVAKGVPSPGGQVGETASLL